MGIIPPSPQFIYDWHVSIKTLQRGEGDKGRSDEGNNFKRILAQLLSFLRKPLTYHVGRSLFIQNDRRTSPLPLCEMNLYLISLLCSLQYFYYVTKKKRVYIGKISFEKDFSDLFRINYMIGNQNISLILGIKCAFVCHLS